MIKEELYAAYLATLSDEQFLAVAKVDADVCDPLMFKGLIFRLEEAITENKHFRDARKY